MKITKEAHNYRTMLSNLSKHDTDSDNTDDTWYDNFLQNKAKRHSLPIGKMDINKLMKGFMEEFNQEVSIVDRFELVYTVKKEGQRNGQ